MQRGLWGPALTPPPREEEVYDKTLDELEQSLKAYSREQDTLVAKSAELKKAMGESALKVQEAQRSYKKLKDETSKGALDAAIDEQVRLKQQLTETEEAIKANNTAYRALYQSATETAAAMSKAENRAGTVSGDSLLDALGKAGLGQMAGDAALGIANTLISSTYGSATGGLLSSGLSGAISGAAMGSLLGPQGTAVGAALGGAVGLASGAAQIFETEDDAFRAYYQQLYEQGQTAADESLSAGSKTAAQRELDAIAFDQLLKGAGDTYLSDLRSLAADTPMEYGDLTNMSRALATGFGDDMDRMLELMTAIGDAGSAVGVDASDMTYMAQVMSRMQSSGKVSLEDLNAFQDRGIDVIGMLSEALGKTQGDLYDMISKGGVGGQTAVDVIQAGLEEQFGGAMELMATTFQGLTSTLEDTMTELDAARGEGYNETRKQGIQAETEAYGGILGDAVANLNRIAGENEAYLENRAEQYTREALSAVLLGQDTTPGLFQDEQLQALEEMRGEFIQASAEYENGSQEAGIKMDSLRQAAEALATAAYESSEQYQMFHDAELDLIGAIRENTSALGSYRNQLERQQSLSIGLGSSKVPGVLGVLEQQGAQRSGLSSSDGPTYTLEDVVSGGKSMLQHLESLGSSRSGFAFGLTRVPYDNYPALLHQGERVLTAREARSADRAAGTVLNLTVTGNTFGGGMTAEEVAQAIANKMVQKLQAGYRG